MRSIVGFSVADEIDKLDRLKKAGSISDAEFSRLRARARAVAWSHRHEQFVASRHKATNPPSELSKGLAVGGRTPTSHPGF
jgi:hypothetical protein